jgi:hypothetical protein
VCGLTVHVNALFSWRLHVFMGVDGEVFVAGGGIAELQARAEKKASLVRTHAAISCPYTPNHGHICLSVPLRP